MTNLSDVILDTPVINAVFGTYTFHLFIAEGLPGEIRDSPSADFNSVFRSFHNHRWQRKGRKLDFDENRDNKTRKAECFFELFVGKNAFRADNCGVFNTKMYTFKVFPRLDFLFWKNTWIQRKCSFCGWKLYPIMEEIKGIVMEKAIALHKLIFRKTFFGKVTKSNNSIEKYVS